MKNPALQIFRQRLLIEGFYQIEVNEKVIQEYLARITEALNLKMYGKSMIFSSGGIGKVDNQGYDVFVPLIDSGISLYIWSQAKCLSAVIDTCQELDKKIAVETTQKFFKINEIEFQVF